MQALREALHATFAAISKEDMTEQWERGMLIFAIPDVRMRVLNDFLVTAQLLAELVASRICRLATLAEPVQGSIAKRSVVILGDVTRSRQRAVRFPEQTT
jgi:hypothetical protein